MVEECSKTLRVACSGGAPQRLYKKKICKQTVSLHRQNMGSMSNSSFCDKEQVLEVFTHVPSRPFDFLAVSRGVIRVATCAGVYAVVVSRYDDVVWCLVFGKDIGEPNRIQNCFGFA